MGVGGLWWGGCLVLLVAVWVVQWTWWRPRRLERMLVGQGLRGTSYRLLVGDVKDDIRLRREVQKKPLSPVSHHIAPRIAPFLLHTVNTYGKMSITWIGPTPGVSIMDPELIREILSNKHGQFPRMRTNTMSKYLATGLISYEGEKWARHRRLINPAFHIEKIKRMLPAFTICCDELLSRWEKNAMSEGSCELDVWPEFDSLTGDSISRAAFGSNYVEGRHIFRLQAEQADLVIQANQTSHIPGYRFLPTKNNNRRREIYREVRSIMRRMIERRERNIKEEKGGNDDLLGLLMASNLSYSEENGESKNIGMTTDEVIEECKLFYFAGQQTTLSLLTWTMIVLGMHPNWQERTREEVLQVCGRNKPEFDDLNRLKIVTMILYEVIRLYPPLALIRRVTCKEAKLGDVTFPPQVQLLIPVLLVHHEKELWGEDASEFRPERFMEGISKASKNQGAFFSFGAGQRICIGQNFALMEAKMCLSRILQHFSFDLSPSYIHAPKSVITIQPQHGAQIILHKL